MIIRAVLKKVNLSVMAVTILVGFGLACSAVSVSAATASVPVPYTYNPTGDFELMPGLYAAGIGDRFSGLTPPYSSNNNPAGLEFATFLLNVPTIAECTNAEITGIRIRSITTSTFEQSSIGNSDDFLALTLYDPLTNERFVVDTIITTGYSPGGLVRGTGPNSGNTTIAGALEGVWNLPLVSDGQYGFVLMHDSNDGSTFETNFEVFAEYDDADCFHVDGAGEPQDAPASVRVTGETLASTGQERGAVIFIAAMIILGSGVVIQKYRLTA